MVEQALQRGEEAGELFKATAQGAIIGSVDEERVDVLMLLYAIANRLDIDLKNHDPT